MSINAQKYLEKIELLNSKIQNKLAELDDLKKLAQGLHSVVLGDKVQSNPTSDRLSNMISKIYDCEKELDELIDTYVDEKNECIWIIEQIQSSNNLQYNILHKRYLQFKEFKTIAEEEHFSESWVFKQHTEALEKVQKILNSTV